MAKFEDCLQRLEKIVQELEKGEVPLEKSLTLFEEGMQLSAACRKELEEAEGKVEILLKQNGKLQAEAFEPPAAQALGAPGWVGRSCPPPLTLFWSFFFLAIEPHLSKSNSKASDRACPERSRRECPTHMGDCYTHPHAQTDFGAGPGADRRGAGASAAAG